jgi:hypothetical protein
MLGAWLLGLSSFFFCIILCTLHFVSKYSQDRFRVDVDLLNQTT